MIEGGKGFSLGDVPQYNERTPEVYEYYLGVPVDSLTDKTVLNIGSGLDGLFEKDAQQAGAHVFSISPYFTHDTPMAEGMRQSYTQPRTSLEEKIGTMLGRDMETGSLTPVAARAEKLPFKDDSFDTITALYSVPLYHEGTTEECASLIGETVRVLKAGGEAVFYPVSQDDRVDLEQRLQGRDISAQFTPVPEIDPPVYHDETPFRLTIQKPIP